MGTDNKIVVVAVEMCRKSFQDNVDHIYLTCKRLDVCKQQSPYIMMEYWLITKMKEDVLMIFLMNEKTAERYKKITWVDGCWMTTTTPVFRMIFFFSKKA